MSWPSTFSPGSLGYMLDRIDDELMKQGTLNTQIQAALFGAVDIYQKERFRFNETMTAYFMTNVGQQDYNINNTTFIDPSFPNVNPTPQQFFKLNKLLITVPPAVFEMNRIQPEEMLILTQTGTQMGQPYNWSYDNETISLYPIPSSGGPGQIQSFVFTSATTSGYTPGYYPNTTLIGGTGTNATANINVVGGQVTSVQLVSPGLRYSAGDTLGVGSALGPGTGFALTVVSTFTGTTGPYKMTMLGHFRYPAPSINNLADTTNRWMIDGERLIRSRTKYEIALHVTRNKDMAIAMSPNEPGASWDEFRRLTVENVRITQRGFVRPMYF